MPALPETSSSQVKGMADQDANYLRAYNVCLQYEKSATNADELRFVRILGFLLLNAPSRGIRSEVTKCIHSRRDDAGLFDFGAFIERYLIVPCGLSVFHSTFCMSICTPYFQSRTKDERRCPAITHQDPRSRSLGTRSRSTLRKPPTTVRSALTPPPPFDSVQMAPFGPLNLPWRI